jgi:L-amino acid N-acyltransferase YncA
MSDDLRERCVLRPASVADASDIARLYNHYVAETVVTFEEVPVAGPDMARRIADVQAAALPWLVAEAEAGVGSGGGGESVGPPAGGARVSGASGGPRLVGYAYAAPWRTRSAYRFSVEVTVYLAPDYTGRGLGTRLYGELFALLETAGMHVALGGIALPNDASVALHEKLGMRKVAHLEQVGFKFGRWIDVGYWQRTLAE